MIAVVNRTMSTAERKGPSLCVSGPKLVLAQPMSAANPPHCNQSERVIRATAALAWRTNVIGSQQAGNDGSKEKLRNLISLALISCFHSFHLLKLLPQIESEHEWQMIALLPPAAAESLRQGELGAEQGALVVEDF